MSTRKYKCSDVVMLVVLNSIAQSFVAFIAELSTIRTNWTAAYAAAFKTSIATAVEKYLGLDPKKVLRDATSAVNAIQEPATRDIAFLKSQLDVDFANEKTTLAEILKTLGFKQHLRDIQKGNHEALVSFLQTYKKNLTADIKKSIVDKGTSAQLLDRITGYADTFTVAEMTQESLKTSTKEIPAAAIDALNELYTEGIGICKIASKFYLANAIKKEQFTFDAVLKKVKIQAKKSGPGPESPKTT